MEFRAASRLPQAPAREGRKPVVCRTHNIWEPLPRLPENPGKPRTRGSGVLSLSAYATIWHRPLVPPQFEEVAGADQRSRSRYAPRDPEAAGKPVSQPSIEIHLDQDWHSKQQDHYRLRQDL